MSSKFFFLLFLDVFGCLVQLLGWFYSSGTTIFELALYANGSEKLLLERVSELFFGFWFHFFQRFSRVTFSLAFCMGLWLA